MAEEEKDESGGGGGGGGGGLVKTLMMVVPALLIGLGGGYMVGKTFTEQSYQEADKKDPEAEKIKKDLNELVGPVVKLDPFVVNLRDQRGNRYLKTTVQLEVESSDVVAEIERRKPQIQDVILALLTSKTTPELQALEGKFKLREEILSRVNALLVNGSAKRVYFTEFVIQ